MLKDNYDIHIVINRIKKNITLIKSDVFNKKVPRYFTQIAEDTRILTRFNELYKSDKLFNVVAQVDSNMDDAQETLSTMNHPSLLRLVIDSLNTSINSLNTLEK